ncbi:hypothetical protein [Achromobacter aloeverae]
MTTAMFRTPEHAIEVAYLMLALPIEGKNNTQIIIEQLRQRFDPSYLERPLSGLSPHDHHAQAVMTLQLVRRVLRDSPMFHVLQAKFGTGSEGATSARVISEWVNPAAPADSTERELTDLLVGNVLRGRPRIRDISDRFDVSKSAVGRLASAYRVLIYGLLGRAVQRLEIHMQDAGLVPVAADA